MTPILSSPRRIQLSRLLAVLAPFTLLAPLQARSQEQVIWTPVTDEQAEEAQILVPALDGGAGSGSSFQNEATTKLQPIVWEVVPEAESKANAEIPSTATVVWESLPGRQQPSSDGAIAPPTAIVWEVIPDTAPALLPDPAGAIAGIEEANPEDSPPPEVIAQEQSMPPRELPALPPPPQLQALDRSIAFGDGLVGPDIGFSVPNGFRWSERWFGNATIRGISRRREGEEFLAWNSGDGDAQLHLNLLQTDDWSFGLNSTFRSVYEGSQIAGGSSPVGEGFSMGFRIAKAFGNTAGIALGGEQIAQFDSKSDQGRNFYLMGSKGWWLGGQGRHYPLLIANGGIASGRVALNSPLQLGCIENVENRPPGSPGASVDNDICFGLVGTLGLVMNEWWGVFAEYGQRHSFNASVNLTGGIPLRLTGGVVFAGVPYAEPNEFRELDELTWTLKASLGF